MKRPRRRKSTEGASVPVPADDSESMRIRKITNGYLIERSGTRRGKYFSHEEYSASKPVITANVPKKSGARS